MRVHINGGGRFKNGVCVCVCVCLWGRRGGGGNSICFVVLLKRKIH